MEGKWKKGFQSCEQWSIEVWNIKGWLGHLAGHFSLISKLLLSLFNYLRKPDGAAESDRYSNVVSHPQVDGMDTATHVDLVMQAFTLIHTEERQLEPSLQKWSPKPGVWRKTMSRGSVGFVYHQLSSQNQPDENAETLRDMNAFIERLSKNVSKVFLLKTCCSIPLVSSKSK